MISCRVATSSRLRRLLQAPCPSVLVLSIARACAGSIELKSRRELQGAALHKRRERASACPLPLSEAEMNRFIQESQIGAADPPCQVPDAAKLVCRMRETFREAVFCLPGCSATQWFRFPFCCAKPISDFSVAVGGSGSELHVFN